MNQHQWLATAVISLFIFCLACGDSESHTTSIENIATTEASNTQNTSNTEPESSDITSSPGTFTYSGIMGIERTSPAAVSLKDGRVLILGGRGKGSGRYAGIHASSEIYDPSTGLWSGSGEMSEVREEPTATLLADGKVLVIGGRDTLKELSGDPELFDPSTNTWTKVSKLNDPRESHGAVLLDDGKVLVVGGKNSMLRQLSSSELYNPDENSWTEAGESTEARINHTVTLLSDGRVLSVGGGKDDGPYLKSAEIYDPDSNTWTPVPEMSVSRALHSATLLKDGRVLVVGGKGKKTSAEIYMTQSLTHGLLQAIQQILERNI